MLNKFLAQNFKKRYIAISVALLLLVVVFSGSVVLVGGITLVRYVAALELPGTDFVRQFFSPFAEILSPETLSSRIFFPETATETPVERIAVANPRENPILDGAILHEEQIVAVVERAAQSVVSIIVTRDLPVLERYFINPFEGFGPPGFEFQIPRYRERGTEQQEIGGGTGFIVSSDGLILTNNHVVADQVAGYTVLLNDGRRLPARVIGRDAVLDLAILRIESSGLPVLSLGDSDRLRLGQSAIAIGNALGEFRNTVSTGVISGLGRTVSALGEGGQMAMFFNAIQTDAAINRGNSGGPLLNIRGEVIGINTAMAAAAQNIGFAIPVNDAKRMIEEARATGRIAIPFLGVRHQSVNQALSQREGLPVTYGAWLISDRFGQAVAPDSPAARAGLMERDLITEINGRRIDAGAPLAIVLREHRVGQTITLRVWRFGTGWMDVRVVLGEAPVR